MRGLTSTNYDIQALDVMKKDLLEWQKALEEDINKSEIIINSLKMNIWKQISGGDKLRICIEKSVLFLKTSLKDISQVNSEINIKIQQRHVKTLRHIGDEAVTLNAEIGQARNNGDRFSLDNKEEELYGIVRDMLHDLIDLQSLSERLDNYIGDYVMNKTNWTKIGALATIVSVIVAIVIGIYMYKNNNNQTNNVMQNNTINADQFIINNNGNVNKTNTEVNNK